MDSEKKSKNNLYKVIIVLFAVFIVSCIYRYPSEGEGFYNSDATYHVLLTMQAYDDSKFSDHSFLPIQTYGSKNNKSINNGPSILQDVNGNNFYVSFSPLGFYAPYLFCKIFHFPLSIGSIYVFNCLLMLICALLCSYLIYIIFKEKKFSIMAFVAYIFIPEILFTQGIVYWHHSLSQVLLLSQLVLFAKLTFQPTLKHKRFFQILFLLVSFLYPYLEWTGFVSNIGFAICIFINGFYFSEKDQKRKLNYNHVATTKVVILGVITVLSLGYYLWRFSKISMVSEIITSMLSRASVRAEANYIDLLKGYLNSYKPQLFFPAICIILTLFNKKTRKNLWTLISDKKILVLLIAATIPLFENIVMTGHAILYTFDRLKFAPLLILIMMLAISSLSSLKKKWISLCIVSSLAIISLWGLSTYSDDKMVDFKDGYKNTLILKDYLNENYLNDDKAILAKRGFRAWGFLQTMYHRNIYCTDTYSDTSLKNEAEKHNYRYIIYLTQGAFCWDTGVYEYAEVLDIETGDLLELSIKDGKVIVSKK